MMKIMKLMLLKKIPITKTEKVTMVMRMTAKKLKKILSKRQKMKKIPKTEKF